MAHTLIANKQEFLEHEKLTGFICVMHLVGIIRGSFAIKAGSFDGYKSEHIKHLM